MLPSNEYEELDEAARVALLKAISGLAELSMESSGRTRAQMVLAAANAYATLRGGEPGGVAFAGS